MLNAAERSPCVLDVDVADPSEGGLEQEPDVKAITRRLSEHRGGDRRLAIRELLFTVPPLLACWLLMWLSLEMSYALTLLLAIPAAGFLLRLFLIQHDCGHGTFFPSRRANDWLGRCLGVVTLSPYEFWKQTHAMHHAGTGNLSRRGIGDVDTLTVTECRSLSRMGRLRYWLYRHPLVIFLIGPAYLFYVRYRLPLGLARRGWRPWISTGGTNLAILAVSAGLIMLIGLGPFLMIQLPVTLMAATVGVYLFYVQHQFEHTRWASDDDWQFHEAALYGSSYLVLPRVLRWFTANIGMHHVHHLCSAIPYYRLPAAMAANPELDGVTRLTFRDSLRCLKLTLWDEDAKRLISFREARLLEA